MRFYIKITVWTLLCLLLAALTVPAAAQSHLAVNIGHPVYALIESAEVKGLATRLSQAKPYTKRQIQAILAQIQAKDYALSNHEKRILQHYIDEFSDNFDDEASIADNVLKGRVDLGFLGTQASIGLGFDAHIQAAAGGKNQAWLLSPGDADFESSNQTDAYAPTAGFDAMLHRKEAIEDGNYYLRMPLKFYARGDTFNGYLSFRMDAQISFDHLRQYPFAHIGWWQPSGMGFHQSLSSQDAGDATTGAGLAFGYEMRPEIAAELWDNRIMMRWGILENRQAGAGLVYSKDAAPYAAFEFAARITPWMNVYTMIGSLGNDKTDSQNKQALQNQKMISFHMGEFFMSDYFYLGLWEAVIWGKRFELAYLNPVNIYMIAQNLTGDTDNMAMGLAGATIIPRVGKIWAELFLDELKLAFSSPRMETALQAGMRFNLPWLPFTTIKAQYTKIEPFTYTHYPQSYASNGLTDSGEQVKTDTSFSNRGKGLAHYLKPNSDESMLAIESLPFPGLKVELGYSLIRHGNSLPVKYYADANGTLYEGRQQAIDASNNIETGSNYYRAVWFYDKQSVYGELDARLHYSFADKFKKNFLKDGIYDWTNMLSLNVSYDFSQLRPRNKKIAPLTLSLGYQFAHTFFDTNGITQILNPEGRFDPADPDYAANYAETYTTLEQVKRMMPGIYDTKIKNVFTLKLTLYPNY